MTSEAMMTICTIMRMELGIWLRIIEMNRLEKAVTSVSAIDITSAVLRLEVTASAEQMPRIWSPIGLFLKIGSNRTSLMVGCAMSVLSCAQMGQEGAEALRTQPVFQKIVDAVAGERGAGQAVDLMGGVGVVGVDRALDDRDDGLAAFIVDLLAGPQRLPAGVVDLAAQTGGLGMLVEAEALHGVQVVLEGDEAVQGRPQAIAAHRQQQGHDLALVMPEYATQYNIGLHYTLSPKESVFKSLYIQTDAYYNEIDDKIVAVPAGNMFRWMMLNLGKVQIKGIELNTNASIEPHKHLLTSLRLNYTYQQAMDITNKSAKSYKHQIVYIPKHSGSVIASIDYKTWGMNYSFIYTGKRYNAKYNDVNSLLQPWYTSDINFRKDFSFKSEKYKLRTILDVNNLFNQHYDVVLNYPMPGRNYRLTLKLTL